MSSNEENGPDGNTAANLRIATYPLQKLMDYDFLMKHFYNVHTSTTADRQLMNAENLLSKDITLQRRNSRSTNTSGSLFTTPIPVKAIKTVGLMKL